MARGWPGVRHALLLLVAYSLVVAWLTWPLSRHPTTRLPDPQIASRFDAMRTIWTLAWETHALTTHPLGLLDANIYHPEPRTLFYGIVAFGALPFFAPVFALTGNAALAINATLLGCVVLTATALHLVVRRWTASDAAGVVAAATFLASRWVLWEFVATAPEYAPLQYLPVIILLAAVPTTRRASLVLLGALVVLQCLTDVAYLGIAVLTPLGLIALWRLRRPETRAAGLALLAVVAGSALCMLPIVAGYLDVAHRNPALPNQTLWNMGEMPTSLPLGPIASSSPAAVPGAAFVLILLGGVIRLARRRHRDAALSAPWRHAALWALVGIALTIKPIVVWRGRMIVMPQAVLLGWTGFYDVIRSTRRLGWAALIGLSLLAGVAFAECTRRVPRRVAGALALLALVATWADYRWGLPLLNRGPIPPSYPTLGMPPPSALEAALRESDGPLLELPIGAKGTSPQLQTAAMLRSFGHWRPLLNGYASFWPAAFPARMALANRLPDPDAAATLRRTTGLTHVLVRSGDLIPKERAAWQAFAAQGGNDALRLVGRAGGELLFAVAPPDRP